MATLIETVDYLRCKTAAPFCITFDIFCGSPEAYEKVVNSKTLNRELISKIYKVSPDNVEFYYLPSLHIVKFSIPRIPVQGSRYDSDMHQCQQAILLYDIEL